MAGSRTNPSHGRLRIRSSKPIKRVSQTSSAKTTSKTRGLIASPSATTRPCLPGKGPRRGTMEDGRKEAWRLFHCQSSARSVHLARFRYSDIRKNARRSTSPLCMAVAFIYPGSLFRIVGKPQIWSAWQLCRSGVDHGPEQHYLLIPVGCPTGSAWERPFPECGRSMVARHQEARSNRWREAKVAGSNGQMGLPVPRSFSVQE
jgi:hypothetical protein